MLLLVLFVVPLCAGSAIPTVPGDNSHYVEGESRYIWMPDGDGVPHLVDLQEPVDPQLLNARGGANNQYRLFTRRNPQNAQILIHGNADSIRNSNYDSNKPLMVLVHGWMSNGNSALNTRVTAEYLQAADVNVIGVDWSSVSNGPYTLAVAGVPGVGQFLGNFLVWLMHNFNGHWGSLHLVGFSLGAHIVGTAGRTAGGRPSRVTGLDPAGPQWHNNANALSNRDGQWVETIHTDGGLLGIFSAIADADFYPNGGRNRQPGCTNSSCSHERAHELFAATMRHAHLVGRRCNSISEVANPCTGVSLPMGNAVTYKRGTPGIYNLSTSGRWPY